MKNEDYIPDKKILENYANIMINFASGNGKGIKKGDVVFLVIPECAKPFLKPLHNAILKAGGHPILQYLPDEINKELLTYGSDDQISYFPEKILKGRIDQIDHQIFILSEKNPQLLKDIDPQKIMLMQKSLLPYLKWRTKKENEGKFSWTLCLYPTEALAKEANMTLKEYWSEVIKICNLKDENPIKKWQEIEKEIKETITKLNKLEIEYINVKAPNTDITLKIGKDRQWIGGRGCNIPSFEIFTSPDCRDINGYIEFNEPLYRYGNLIKGIKLEIQNGIITKASATENKKLLLEMLKVKNANRIGEFSLTDSRLSKITKFMAETLYDENKGGKYGNMHLAIGKCFDDSYKGDITKVNHELREKIGLNESIIHTDIVSTTDRIVTATLQDGTKKVIFEDGKFTI